MELRFSANPTVRLVAVPHPIPPIIFSYLGRISTLVAPRTGNLVREVLPIDSRINGKGFGQGYQIWGCIRGSQFSHTKTSKVLTPFS